MNQFAKRRHQMGLFGPVEAEETELQKAAPALLATPEAGICAYEIEAEESGQRLDRVLAARAEAAQIALSRTRIRTLIEDNRVTLAGKPATDPGQKVKAGQTVTIDIPEAAPAEPQAENIPLDVVFEDEHLIVIDKPAGLVVHPASGHESGTLVNALIAHCGASLSGIGGVKRPGIVHRIDKDTSGLLVVAKTDAAHQGLSALFADHGRTLSLTREYVAFVWGRMERRSGMVEAALARHPHNREKMAVSRSDRARDAITHWQAEEFFTSGTAPLTRVACQLETGRTHQIRVHLAHIGHPLLADSVYGSGFKTKAHHLGPQTRAALAALGSRQALHARRLGFEHPVTGEELLFESPLPADLAALALALQADAGADGRKLTAK
jgi:23S rRNA pseudouridine1911/1915/1917 synthase